jgi:hypothetical protein
VIPWEDQECSVLPRCDGTLTRLVRLNQDNNDLGLLAIGAKPGHTVVSGVVELVQPNDQLGPSTFARSDGAADIATGLASLTGVWARLAGTSMVATARAITAPNRVERPKARGMIGIALVLGNWKELTVGCDTGQRVLRTAAVRAGAEAQLI